MNSCGFALQKHDNWSVFKLIMMQIHTNSIYESSHTEFRSVFAFAFNFVHM